MDLSATPHHSHHLVGLPPSTSPPALGERNRQSGKTTSHIDLHTMGDHEDEIPEMSSPPQEVGEEDPIPVYDPSPDIPSHFGIGCPAMRLNMNPQELVMLVMACLISLHVI